MSSRLGMFALNDHELADELRSVELLCSIDLKGPVTLSMGVRRNPVDGVNRPVIVARGVNGVHVLVLPEEKSTP